MAFNGSWVGPSCKFRTVLDFRVTDQTDTQAYVQYRFYVETTGGSFKGTTIRTDWGSSATLYSDGTYADSDWINYGWVDYGSGVWRSGNANYTSNSGNYYSSTASGSYYPSTPTWEPYAPSSLVVERVNDNKNTLSWENNIAAARPYSSIKIERSMDGGEWSEIASISAATSYNDTTTTADHSYQYRIRACNSAAYSDYATCDTVLYNTPAAPTKITASRLTETTVKLEIENLAKTATGLDLQRSEDSLSWEDIPSVDGSPVTETTDNPKGGTFYYRARNTRGDMVSDWSPASNAVVTICAPAAPTLKVPASGVVVSKAVEQIVFEWLHNAIDGSAQTAAKLRYSLDKGATWVEVAIDGGSASYALENAFAINSEITWSVCTKGAHDDYGPWSDNRVFYVYQAPSVAFAQPTDGFVVENTPIAIQLQYDDPSGTLASAILTIYDGSKTAYTRNMGTDVECSILAKEWTPDNGKVYTLTIAVRSSSSLTASATREISVDFVLPQPAVVYIENDPETGYASLVVYVEEAADLEAPKSISIWRESEEGRVLLGEGLQAGTGLVDRYAPLNTDYQYIVTSFADSGAANSQTFANRLDTLWAFMYFANGGIARGKWNPEASWKMDQDVDYVRYIGREYPVAYMRDSMEETHNVTVTLMDRDEMRAFRKMMSTHEPVVAKLWDALVFHAVPQVQGKPKSTVKSYWGEVAVSLTRIDGEAL